VPQGKREGGERDTSSPWQLRGGVIHNLQERRPALAWHERIVREADSVSSSGLNVSILLEYPWTLHAVVTKWHRGATMALRRFTTTE
jgi:hypothetical protein